MKTTNLSEIITLLVSTHPYSILFLLSILLYFFGTFCLKLLTDFKTFNESNLSDRMTIARDIIKHKKNLGVPMKVELGWKRFLIVPLPVPLPVPVPAPTPAPEKKSKPFMILP